MGLESQIGQVKANEMRLNLSYMDKKLPGIGKIELIAPPDRSHALT